MKTVNHSFQSIPYIKKYFKFNNITDIVNCSINIDSNNISNFIYKDYATLNNNLDDDDIIINEEG
ncbi:8679_t:CDS:2 [Racocetra fulgida]|uniref:8679_t:CDS:1 n=1 Tax=Racocetra fulgida TaxID=60492 RepID=A0A9N9AQE8_9GLOM|nr:8679_t:CDS:2 [Racocetra fulgida]